MARLIGMIVGGVILGLAMIGVAFFVGLRRKSPTVRRLVRAFARAVVNPRILASAGTPGAYASIVEHIGRTSGRPYRTPVVAEPTDDGFVIALPYGTTSNWVKNVLATGFATVVHEGVTYPVDRPEIAPLAPMAHLFPPKEQRTHDRFRVGQCLVLRRPDLREPRAPDVAVHVTVPDP